MSLRSSLRLARRILLGCSGSPADEPGPGRGALGRRGPPGVTSRRRLPDAGTPDAGGGPTDAGWASRPLSTSRSTRSTGGCWASAPTGPGSSASATPIPTTRLFPEYRPARGPASSDVAGGGFQSPRSTSRRVWTFGQNLYGQRGDGTTNHPNRTTTPNNGQPYYPQYGHLGRGVRQRRQWCAARQLLQHGAEGGRLRVVWGMSGTAIGNTLASRGTATRRR